MIKLAIRQLVEWVMRSGDIDSRYVAKDRMLEGAKAHRALQKQNRRLYADYQSEVRLKMPLEHNGLAYELEGRADGIFSVDGQVLIDEIKTTSLPLDNIHDDHIAHWAQAICYAYIHAAQNDLAEISVQLTYFNLESHDTKKFIKTYPSGEVAEFVMRLIEEYAVWAAFSAEWMQIRDHSVKELAFPFPSYRKGQRELAVSAYRAIAGGRKLFVQAPTGTGKTISALFPAVKAIGEGQTSKVFYLTAKTITRQVAEEALEKMRRQGLRLKTLTLTAKEKICFCEKTACNPDYCEYAKGHYDRVNTAVLEAIAACDAFSRSTVEYYARAHRVCPFEFSLDLSVLADCVVCDYNYVFDPRAHLRRFFADESGDYVFLIDEAHNLVDRSREMFSAQLGKTHFYEVKKAYKGRSKALDKILNRINKYLIGWRHECGEQGFFVQNEPPLDLLGLLNDYTAACEQLLKADNDLSQDNAFLQLYFECLGFLTIAEFYDERYVTFVEAQREEVTVKLFCLDPSYLLQEAFRRGRSAVLFSATLSPPAYFRDILGGTAEDKMLVLDSPFERGRLCVLTADRVSTRYKDREHSRHEIAALIGAFALSKTGNYIIYFPSYKYMDDVYREFADAYPGITAVKQETSLSEQEREDFLARFTENPEKTYVAFCVLGGIFSEGIDLTGSRLIGTAIVSVGLPQLSLQHDIIKDYFNAKNGQGFEYAYMYPGLNKVLQAAGRVIRSESDTGTVLLIDERFSHSRYSALLPKHWHPRRKVRDTQALAKALGVFWAEHDN